VARAGVSYDETKISLLSLASAVNHRYTQDGMLHSDSDDGKTNSYIKTERYAVVDGHTCRIWEGGESGGVKLLELCVADVETIAGGREIVRMYKNLTNFLSSHPDGQDRQFGSEDWWNDIDKVDGLPISIRYFRAGTAQSETILSGSHEKPLAREFFVVPTNFTLEQPAEKQ
jgi:hypothetical protein